MYYAIKKEILELSLVGAVFFGMSKSFGEVVIQGFLKGFPPNIIAGFASGTGLAGLTISIYYFIMKFVKFDIQTVFQIMFPFYFFFYIFF